MKKKYLPLIILSVFLLVLVSCKSNEQITVFSGGESEYSIITAVGASDEAVDLAKKLAEFSGESLKVYNDTKPETTFEILIGDTNRAATQELVPDVYSMATMNFFHFVVAERDGKLIIFSNSDAGYIYALDYINETYIKEGELVIPKNTYDIQQVMWNVYYNSDHYYDKLLAESDKNRYEEGKDQFNNEMNRYEDINGNPIMTVEEAIDYYKNLAASFNIADFGTYTATEFTSKNTYDAPTFYPGESHPRILFTENTIDQVRNNLTSSQNANAYKRYLAHSSAPCDGKFKTLTGNELDNFDGSIAAKIEAKAFRYAMTGEKIFGYEAIYAAKNAILTIDVSKTLSDYCRRYGYLMYVVSCVYDWCYDLLTETDKTQLINGTVNILGMHQEIVCYVDSTNKAPIGQGVLFDHGVEDQLLVDYLSFAIACYNEAPEIYKLCAGRILEEYTVAQNYRLSSGSYGEGSMYSTHRGMAIMVSNVLFSAMTDGTERPFTDKLEDVATTLTFYIRPDDQAFRIGDLNENHSKYQLEGIGAFCFLASNLYESDYLKSYAYKCLDNFSYYQYGTASLTPVMFLATNNIDVSNIYTGTAPLTHTTGVGFDENGKPVFPDRSIFAKSGDGKNDFALYMTMPDYFVASHMHQECGSFQIFYKGALASDSGVYAGWGGEHHFGYTVQSIASNSLQIFNPDLVGTKNDYRNTLIYTGGQSIKDCGYLPKNLYELEQYPTFKNSWCKSLGTVNVEKEGVYLYSYMGGDMTGAYDEDTLGTGGEATRYMFAVATGNSSCPLAFITFDRITSAEASYHKAALIHVQQEPTVEGGFAIITNTNKTANGQNSGKMIVQSVGFETDYTVWGGEGKEFWIPGVDENGNYSLEDGYNLSSGKTLIDASVAEYGWGRIEISPKNAEKTNHMLTVMYVTDADNSSSPVAAENISSDNLSGAMIFGKAVLFPTNEKLLESESSFTLTKRGECFIAGVSAGSWTVMNGDSVVAEVEVSEGENLLTFSASSAGTYTLVPAN